MRRTAPPSRARRVWILVAVLGLVGFRATPATAQVPTLDRVDSLVTAGDYEPARETLERWWSAREQFDVPGSDMARALMLRGQLAPDPETAEPDYLAVVLGYPTSVHAPEALLRLGQGLLATGEAARAAAYLERLVADYPGRPQRPVALLWLARANTAARRPAAACRVARAGLDDARDPDLVEMLRIEAAASCSLEAVGTASAEPATGEEARAETPQAADEGGEENARVAEGPWAVQTGAFRYQSSADALMERLREAGYSPRLVRVPANDLLRVRIGRFANADPARALVQRLRSEGFDAVAVNDAEREREQ